MAAQAEYLARVVRREVASTACFKPRPLNAGNGPPDACANRVAVTLRAFEFQANPVIFCSRVVLQQNRRSAVVSHQDIEASVVVEITDSEAARCERLLKYRT